MEAQATYTSRLPVSPCIPGIEVQSSCDNKYSSSTPNVNISKSADQCLICSNSEVHKNHDLVVKVAPTKPRIFAMCMDCDNILSQSEDSDWQETIKQAVYKCTKCANPKNTWDTNVLCKDCMLKHPCKVNKVKMRVGLAYAMDSVIPYIVPK